MYKIILIILINIFVLYLIQSMTLKLNQNQNNLREINKQSSYKLYRNWKHEHDLIFEKQEDIYRFKIFQETCQYIQQRNQQESYQMLGLNNYSALTQEEFKQKYLINTDNLQDFNNIQFYNDNSEQLINLPKSINWVQKGAVPSVVQAQNCNSSYAISAAAALSGIYQIKTGTLLQLSAQQLLSCDQANHGCLGGSDYLSFLYVMKYGIEKEQSYPYTENQKVCNYESENIVFKSNDALRIKPKKVSTINQKLAQQPLSAWINADCEDFRHYKGGEKTFTGNFCQTGDRTNYVVLLAGYNDFPENKEKPYLLLQTSMGTKWGNAGYMNLSKKDLGQGALNVYQRVSFPSYEE